MLKRYLVLGVLMLAVALTVAADTKVVQMHHTDAIEMMGQKQPAKDEEAVTWYGKDRMSMHSGDTGFVVRLDRNKMYFINFGDQTYAEIDLPIDLAKLLPPEMAKQMAGMMEMMKMSVKATPTDEYKQIGDWQARRWNVTVSGQMMNMEHTIWATTEVDLDAKTAWDLSKQTMLLQPGMEEMVTEMGKVEGFHLVVDSTVKMMGSEIKSSVTTTAIEDGNAPDGAYEPPAGFTKTDFNPMPHH